MPVEGGTRRNEVDKSVKRSRSRTRVRTSVRSSSRRGSEKDRLNRREEKHRNAVHTRSMPRRRSVSKRREDRPVEVKRERDRRSITTREHANTSSWNTRRERNSPRRYERRDFSNNRDRRSPRRNDRSDNRGHSERRRDGSRQRNNQMNSRSRKNDEKETRSARRPNEHSKNSSLQKINNNEKNLNPWTDSWRNAVFEKAPTRDYQKQRKSQSKRLGNDRREKNREKREENRVVSNLSSLSFDKGTDKIGNNYRCGSAVNLEESTRYAKMPSEPIKKRRIDRKDGDKEDSVKYFPSPDETETNNLLRIVTSSEDEDWDVPATSSTYPASAKTIEKEHLGNQKDKPKNTAPSSKLNDAQTSSSKSTNKNVERNGEQRGKHYSDLRHYEMPGSSEKLNEAAKNNDRNRLSRKKPSGRFQDTPCTSAFNKQSERSSNYNEKTVALLKNKNRKRMRKEFSYQDCYPKRGSDNSSSGNQLLEHCERPNTGSHVVNEKKRNGSSNGVSDTRETLNLNRKRERPAKERRSSETTRNHEDRHDVFPSGGKSSSAKVHPKQSQSLPEDTTMLKRGVEKLKVFDIPPKPNMMPLANPVEHGTLHNVADDNDQMHAPLRNVDGVPNSKQREGFLISGGTEIKESFDETQNRKRSRSSYHSNGNANHQKTEKKTEKKGFTVPGAFSDRNSAQDSHTSRKRIARSTSPGPSEKQAKSIQQEEAITVHNELEPQYEKSVEKPATLVVSTISDAAKEKYNSCVSGMDVSHASTEAKSSHDALVTTRAYSQHATASPNNRSGGLQGEVLSAVRDSDCRREETDGAHTRQRPLTCISSSPNHQLRRSFMKTSSASMEQNNAASCFKNDGALVSTKTSGNTPTNTTFHNTFQLIHPGYHRDNQSAINHERALRDGQQKTEMFKMNYHLLPNDYAGIGLHMLPIHSSRFATNSERTKFNAPEGLITK